MDVVGWVWGFNLVRLFRLEVCAPDLGFDEAP